MTPLRGKPPDLVALGPENVVSGRPFTKVERTGRDSATLYDILDDLRFVLHEAAEGKRELLPNQHLAWPVGGLTHRLIVCNEERLRTHPQLCVVGFFGERRRRVDMSPLEEANAAIVAEFTKYPGILSYSSIELPDRHWANLVLHDDPIDTQYWRRSERHAEAVRALSPVHYKNVRIHNGRLTSRLLDDPAIQIKQTKYFDYAGGTLWRAERTYSPPLSAPRPAMGEITGIQSSSI